MRAIIVDDETDSIKNLTHIINSGSYNIQIIGTACDCLSAVELIRNSQPDLVFLDVQMPHGNGFQVLEQFPDRKFHVIFITSYNMYAFQAFKVSAIDYLLKPIDEKELSEAINKARLISDFNKFRESQNIAAAYFNSGVVEKICIHEGRNIVFLEIKDIVYFKADGSYTQIFTLQGTKHLASRSIGEFESLLNSSPFFRIHHSYLVNKEFVSEIRKSNPPTVVLQGIHQLPVSRRKKEAFYKNLDLH
ncbi:MAG: LytTR family DNA-binding domain-containing protein [Bacteroidetes bacterium]|nr:LytTR family DNA-binding domain-containing protein [Bacteroidota bacterium]MBU1718371.1 LytTR family DNA-binding domain-containing protein [Bacteroidota bacterium]